jgi:hypothetical protein
MNSNNQIGLGMNIFRLMVYNPNRVKISRQMKIKIMSDNNLFITFHITGNTPKLKKLLGPLTKTHLKVPPDKTKGFYWYNMPTYRSDPKMFYPVLYVGFLSSKDRMLFFQNLDMPNPQKRYVHYPHKILTKSDIQHYKITYTINPRYPVYIISKGRWKSRSTSKALEEMGTPYKIVVEPQEFEQYASVINPKKILVLTKKFLGLNQGSIPARNFVWAHAVASGAKKHWILDDNLRAFRRWNLNFKWKIKSGVLFKLIEDYVGRFSNIKQSGMNYGMFVPARQTSNPITFNTRIYSCILIDHSLDKILKQRWRGRFNEDTDLSLRILKAGYATALFNAFLCDKPGTLSTPGGNTDTIYKGGQTSAIRAKAQSLVNQHPDVTKIVKRYKRGVHHEVNYKPFRKNKLGYKNPRVKKKSNNFNMVLVRNA